MFEGLKNLANIGPMLKQAQELGSRLKNIQEELQHRRAQGTAGAGLVTVEVNGLCEVLSCRIDPSLVKPDDKDMLEDLIVAATNQAFSKAKELHAGLLQSATSGMDLSGLGSAFNNSNTP